MKIELIKISDLKPYKNNAKIHTDDQIQQIINSIQKFGMNDPIGIWKDNTIIEGHGRLEACKKLGYKEVPCIRLDHLSNDERKAYALVHNKLTMNTDFDYNILEPEIEDIEIDMTEFGFDEIEPLDTNLNDKQNNQILVDKYGVPPFSILDTRKGYWQDRKKIWLDLGIKSELGRDENLLGKGLSVLTNKYGSGSKKLLNKSIFDPVLCEVMYKWFSTNNGVILDPFAGGSVRGIVAEKLGYHYIGIELRKEQVDQNVINCNELNVNPRYICDDSQNIDKYIEDESCDMIFSCPPYFDLEHYSDDPKDLSNMEYEEFKKVYFNIIKKICNKLKQDRFAIFVVSDIRDKNGVYRNFVELTKKCFIECGLFFYNDLILINVVGTGALRATKYFALRKVVRLHQNVLCFYKGNIKNIKNNYGDVYIDNVDENYILE